MMENSKDKPKENTGEEASLTPVRESEANILDGARQTDQLEKLQENAKQQESGQQTTYVRPLEVNDGSSPVDQDEPKASDSTAE